MMHEKLAADYFKRAEIRRNILDTLFEKEDYADIVRESQEIVELILKGISILYGIEFPKAHDIGNLLHENMDLFPERLREFIPKLSKISKILRKDRELSFYGSEDIIPLDYYTIEDGKDAISMVDEVISMSKEFKR
ncbi:MAG: HEPN domain-containing protein [Deltaproteobacteria bacterium]|nr:HEPN domain-containing protein [Deltaproteobacteria bacterium]